jgi:hypothetical protein
MALGCGQQVAPTGYSMPRSGDCRVVVLESHPGSGYVEVGELSFDVYAAGAARYQYTDWHRLAAELHGDICAVGGDTLMIERNAAGVIVHGTVFRRANEIELPPPPPENRLPSRSEICEPSCRAGFVCEGGSCIEQCTPASCGEGESCGIDQLCHSDHPDQ